MDDHFEGVFDFRGCSQGVQVGSLEVEFVRMTHSVSDSTGLVIYTPCGTVAFTGDFSSTRLLLTGRLLTITGLLK